MVTYNLGELFESVVDTVSDREAIVSGSRRFTYAAFDERINRIADLLRSVGVGTDDRVALMLRNHGDHLAALLAALKIRAVPVNVNTRYTNDEIVHLLRDADPTVVVHEPDLAPVLDASVTTAVTVAGIEPPVRLTVGDDLERRLVDTDAERPIVPGRSGDDRYILYTGGTTGEPKGVVWRQEDLLFAALAGGNLGGEPVTAPDEVAANARSRRIRLLPASPLSHGTAHWAALSTLLSGGTVVIDDGATFDATRLWDLVERERVTMLVIVGDAFAQPLVSALGSEPDRWDLDHLLLVSSGGAVLSPPTRDLLLRHLPWVGVVDGYGTSETGSQGSMPIWPGQKAPALPRFHVDEHTAVLDDAGRPAPPGSGLVGRLARRGHIPIGYLGDEARTAATFLESSGSRWSVPGDLARIEADGTITLLGRGSSSINRGGEKVFPQEVEMVITAHPAVADVVVAGVPDPRFGEQVAAIVQVHPGHDLDQADLVDHCRRHLAPYKIPRLLVRDDVRRRPSGKADLTWARERLLGELDPPADAPPG